MWRPGRWRRSGRKRRTSLQSWRVRIPIRVFDIYSGIGQRRRIHRAKIKHGQNSRNGEQLSLHGSIAGGICGSCGSSNHRGTAPRDPCGSAPRVHTILHQTVLLECNNCVTNSRLTFYLVCLSGNPNPSSFLLFPPTFWPDCQVEICSINVAFGSTSFVVYSSLSYPPCKNMPKQVHK